MAKGIKGVKGKESPFRDGTKLLKKGWRWVGGKPVRA